MTNNNILNSQKNIRNNDLLHVFLITSPVVSLISSMIIEKNKLHKENIITVSLRRTNLNLFTSKKIYIKTNRISILIEKFLFISINANKILRLIKKSDKKFVVYTPWAFRDLKFLISNKKCKAYFYVEEGQLAYLNHNTYNYYKLSLIEKIRINFLNRIPLNLRLRDDAEGFFCINKNAFKNIPNNKKIILNKFDTLKKNYRQKLKGVSDIGITCASRRVKDKDLTKMLDKLISNMPNGGFIKPHPSFFATEKIKHSLISAFKKVARNNIQLSTNDIIIEIEMLYEKKNLIGPPSSLSIYAELFGSTYKPIKLY